MAGSGQRFTDDGYKVSKPFIRLGRNGDKMIAAVIKNILNSATLELQKKLHFIFVINTEFVDINELRETIDPVLSGLNSNYKLVVINKKTEGAASTCLLAEKYINNSFPLIVVNCDQIIEDLDLDAFISFATNRNIDEKIDGIVGTFFSNNPKNSFVRVDDATGKICEFKEKKVISNLALNGFHYWSQGHMFVSTAKRMIADDIRVNNEFYVSETYNYMLKDGCCVLPYHFNLHYPIGIPADFEYYLKLRRYIGGYPFGSLHKNNDIAYKEQIDIIKDPVGYYQNVSELYKTI